MLSEQNEVAQAETIFERAKQATGAAAAAARAAASGDGDTSSFIMLQVLHARVLQLYAALRQARPRGGGA